MVFDIELTELDSQADAHANTCSSAQSAQQHQQQQQQHQPLAMESGTASSAVDEVLGLLSSSSPFITQVCSAMQPADVCNCQLPCSAVQCTVGGAPNRLTDAGCLSHFFKATHMDRTRQCFLSSSPLTSSCMLPTHLITPT